MDTSKLLETIEPTEKEVARGVLVSIVWGGGLASSTFEIASGVVCRDAVWVLESMPFCLREPSI